jgi:hypothetical protein
METSDSQGRILPVGAADQGIISKKTTDKEGQGQRLRQQPRKVAVAPAPEKDAEEGKKENHVIDILV